MKNNISNFDQKILPNQTLFNIKSTSKDNNQFIRELDNNMISSQLFTNKIEPKINMVCIFIIDLIFFYYQLLNKGNNNIFNLNSSNIYQNKVINTINNDNCQNLNNNYLLNINSQKENKSGDLYQDYLKNLIFLNQEKRKVNQNREIYNNFNNNNEINIDNNFNLNNFDQSRFSNFFEKSNIYNNKFNLNRYSNYYSKSNIFPTINNDNSNNIPLTNNSLNNNIYNSYFNNYLQNLNQNPNQLINLYTDNSQKNLDIKTKDKGNPFSNSSLTYLLSNKNGISQIKNILNKEQYNTNLIRKIILILNEENGLHIVFKNIYGNYFIQELFQKMNNDLIQLTIDLISSEFVNISKSPCGTHCLQKLLNFINNSEMEISIIKAIKYKEKEMAFDENATYVLQKIITIIPDKKRVRLNNLIINNAKELSLNANSVFVLKKFISTNTIEENRIKIIDIIIKYFTVISQNPYGNYVIQYLFEVWPSKKCELIINEIINKGIDLSFQKYSVNIVLKALEIFNNNYKQKLINSLCFSSYILNLLKNKYSYYTINKAIKYMDNNTKAKFEHFLKQKMKNYIYKEKLLINQIISLLKVE